MRFFLLLVLSFFVLGSKNADAQHQIYFPELQQARMALWKGEFEKLDALMKENHERIHAEENDSGFYLLYYGLSIDHDIFPKQIEEWVKATQSSYAYTAGCAYQSQRGYEERGTAFSKDTATEKLKNMNAAHRKGYGYCVNAIKKLPENTMAYTLIIGMLRAARSSQDAQYEVFERGLEHSPNSYILYSKYLGGTVQRWGGTYEYAKAIVEAMPEGNPHLKLIKKGFLGYHVGMAYNLKAIRSRSKGSDGKSLDTAESIAFNDKSIAVFKEAAKEGGYADLDGRLAYHYYRDKDYSKAAEHYKKTIAFMPHVAKNYYRLSICQEKLGDIKAALQNAAIAYELNPSTENYFKRARRLERL